MPKKTKREKRIAEQRRTTAHPTPFQFTAQISEPIHTLTVQTVNGDIVLIQKDLLKTILLAIFAIGSEIFLAKIIR